MPASRFQPDPYDLQPEINTVATDNLCRLQNIVQKWSNRSPDGEENVLMEKALKEFRKFNIDITPKVLY